MTTHDAGSAGRLPTAALWTVLIGSALAPIDLFIVNVALPSIAADLRTSPAAITFVVSAYSLGFALLLVIGGRLGDRFGRRRLFVVGLSGFTVMSAACGFAPSSALLISARALQGAAAAMAVPQVLSIIQAGTGGGRRARAIGYYGATGGIAMVIGQLAGGLLVSADVAGAAWRAVFLVNVPIGVLAVLLSLRTVPESRSTGARVDLLGTLLVAAALLCLLVGVTEGPALGWPAWCWTALGCCPLLAAAFAAVERRLERQGREPLLPPTLLRLPSMSNGLCLAVLFFVVFGGLLFVLTLFLQDDLHLAPLTSGLAVAPLGAAFLAMALVATRLVSRFGRRTLALGGVLTATGLALLVLTVQLGWSRYGVAVLAPSTLVVGAGFGTISPNLFHVILSRVPTCSAGVGSGVLTTTQQASTALGVATIGSLFTGLRGIPAVRAQTALVVTLLALMVLALALAALSTRLPGPGH